MARAFAAALLDGDWTVDAMAARLADTVGQSRVWMRTMAKTMLRAFPEPPRDAPSRVARLLPQMTSFSRAVAERTVVIRHWRTPAPVMGPPRWPVPVLHTSGDLAAWLEMDALALAVLADRRGLSREAPDWRMRHYRYAWIDKFSGGQRLLEAPKRRLKTAQRRILDGILAPIPVHPAAHGFVSGRSVRSFATPHVGKAVVLRMDLQAFFTSIFAGRVYGLFRTVGYPEEVARTLTSLCTHRTPTDILAMQNERDADQRARLRSAHLPQGAPTSGALANLAAFGLDVRLTALAKAIGATYTRYADDLALSGPAELVRAAPSLIARIGAIAIEQGFAVNFRKTRVMTAASRQRIAGVVVNEKLAVPKVEVERLRAILHNCARTGPAAQNRDGVADFHAHLQGRVAWVEQLDPGKGARLRAAMKRIVWD